MPGDVTSASLLVDAVGLISTFNLFPLIAVSAIAGVAMFLVRRAKTAAR